MSSTSHVKPHRPYNVSSTATRGSIPRRGSHSGRTLMAPLAAPAGGYGQLMRFADPPAKPRGASPTPVTTARVVRTVAPPVTPAPAPSYGPAYGLGGGSNPSDYGY